MLYISDYETVATSNVFARTRRDVVLSGFNATVFAYGQTGSGKTHTMLGSEDSPGMMGRTLQDLFQFSSKSTRFTVSFIELYNEEIRDLLNPGSVSGSGPGLDLREDPVRGAPGGWGQEVQTDTSDAVWPSWPRATRRAHRGHRSEPRLVALPRRAAGNLRAVGRGQRWGRRPPRHDALLQVVAHRPRGLRARSQDGEPRAAPRGGRQNQPVAAGAGQLHQRAWEEGHTSTTRTRG